MTKLQHNRNIAHLMVMLDLTRKGFPVYTADPRKVSEYSLVILEQDWGERKDSKIWIRLGALKREPKGFTRGLRLGKDVIAYADLANDTVAYTSRT